MYFDHMNSLQGILCSLSLCHHSKPVFMFVVRIDCFANSEINSSNIQPQISRGGSFSGSANATIDENIFYNWPHQTYLNFSARLPSHLYGQYICRSMIGYYVRNYIHDSELLK